MTADFMNALEKYLNARENVDGLGWQEKIKCVAECRDTLEIELNNMITNAVVNSMDKHEMYCDHNDSRRYD